MQEFMILPTGAANFRDAMRIGCEVYHNLKSIIKSKYGQDGKKIFKFADLVYVRFIFILVGNR